METTEATAPPKPDLSTENLDYKVFEVVKSVASELYSKKRCYIEYETNKIFPELLKAGLREEKILLECLIERTNKHNGTIRTACTKIKDLRKEGRWWLSKLFQGIGLDIDKCRKLTKQFQHFDTYEIAKVYFDATYQPKERKPY